MKCIGQVQSIGGEGVPSIYKDVVTSCLDCPKVGVEVVITTDTHLVELYRGLVVRSCRIGSKNQVRRIRMLQQGEDAKNWFYVLEDIDRVSFLRGRDLELVKVYSGVEEVTTGDFLNIGRLLVKIKLTDFEVILTDGDTEYDIDQIKDKEQDELAEMTVNKVLEKRLAMTREAVVRATADLEVTTKLVEESIKELMLSCEIDELVEFRSVQNLPKEKVPLNEEKKMLIIIGHWSKLVRGEVMIGLELETEGDCGEIFDVEMQIVNDDEELEFRYFLLQMARRGESLFVQKISKLGVTGHSMKSTLVAKVPFSIINPSVINRLKASVSYSSSHCRRRLHTKPIPISLHPIDFCSDALAPSFSPSMALQTFSSVYLTGIREILTLSTDLGFLLTLPGLLAKLKFTLTESIGGYLLDCPAHPLYLSIIMLNIVDSKQVEAIMYAQDYSHLSLLIRLLREVLPADIQFHRVEEEVTSL